MRFWTDDRVILRRWEFERLLVPLPGDDKGFGGRYSDALLATFFETDPSQTRLSDFYRSHRG
jgi:hypothetical protein